MRIFTSKGKRKAEAYEANIEIKALNAESLTNGIQNIVEILRTTKIHKVQGALIKFDISNDNAFLGKCAMGVISCEVGLTLDRHHYNHPLRDILLKAGIPEEYVNLDYPFPNPTGSGLSFSQPLQYCIIDLNDGAGFTFPEIADYLETTFIPEELS